MDENWFHWRGDLLTIRVRAVPRARQTQFEGIQNNALKVRLNAPPVDGKANKALQIFLAKEFGVPRGRVQLLSGEKSREKQFQIDNPSRLPACLTMALSA